MAKAPVEVATPKFELVTCVRKCISSMAEGVESVWIMLLFIVSMGLPGYVIKATFYVHVISIDTN